MNATDSLSSDSGKITFKDRTGWLIAFGTAEILFGIGALGTAVLMLNLNKFATEAAGSPALPPGVIAVLAGFYALIAIIFISAGIGSALRKNWARLLMVVISSLWLALGVLSSIGVLMGMSAVSQRQHLEPVARNLAVAFTIVLLVVIPAILLLFNISRNVRATCLGAEGPSERSGVPPSILVVVALLTFTALSLVVMASFLPFLLLFGLFMHGWSARMAILCLAVLYGYLGWAFFRRYRRGWTGTVVLTGFMAVSGIVSSLVMSPQQVLGKMNYTTGWSSSAAHSSLVFGRAWSLTMGAAVWIAYFVLLWYTRRYFVKPQQSTRAT